MSQIKTNKLSSSKCTSGAYQWWVATGSNWIGESAAMVAGGSTHPRQKLLRMHRITRTSESVATGFAAHY